jgi:hypothetical protein
LRTINPHTISRRILRPLWNAKEGFSVAKAISPEDAVLAALRKAVAALPAALPLSGTGGLFPGGPKGPDLAGLADAQGLITKREEKPKKGKPKVYGVITEKGIRRVLDADNPKTVLEALLPAVQALGKQPDPPNPDTFRTELARATETCVNAVAETCARAIKATFDKLEGEIGKALAPAVTRAPDSGPLLNALRGALERVEAPKPPAVPSPAPAVVPGTSPHADSTPALEEAVLAFVKAWAREKTVGCQFDDLWKHLEARHPRLTIGSFHDALRRLHDAGRVRLGGWARMLDDMPKPELALFVSSKVMYYVQPVHTTG